MGMWDVYWVNEIADRAYAEKARIMDRQEYPPVELSGGPGHQRVEADELRVEGGALVFIKNGQPELVVGPTTYRLVYRRN